MPASSIKRNVGVIGQRPEREAKQATGEAAYAFRRTNRLPLDGPPLAVQINAGYIKTTRPQADGKRWAPLWPPSWVRSTQRLKRNGHMRWTRDGANSLLQVRCAVLNRLDICNCERWYPLGKPFALLPRARLLS